MIVEVNNLTKSLIKEGFIKKIAKKVLIGENKKKKVLSVVLVGSSKIRELNKRYRKKDKVTDVLSFQYDESGEIVICLPQVRKNAKKLKTSFEQEFGRVLIHGLLHLLGYDHEVKDKLKAKKMQEKEEYYLLSF